MGKTTIAWCEHTWNPTRGCSRTAPGCLHCYAERMAARQLPNMAYQGEHFAVMTPHGPSWTGRVSLIPEMLDIPLKRRKPTTYFVNSMSDLFHERLSIQDIYRVFAVMEQAPQHRFIVLTKRGARMRDVVAEIYGAGNMGYVLPHVVLGVSASTQKDIDEQGPHLIQTPASCRMLSLEPLLEDINIEDHVCCTFDCDDLSKWPELCSRCGRHVDLHRKSLDGVIVGGESGPGARPCHVEHIRSVVRQCKAAGVPCFVKQMGARIVGDPAEFSAVQWEDAYGRFGLGGAGDDPYWWPEDLRVREMPEVLR